MTDIRKSDAQFDAEASAPLEERDLEAAIELHRILYAADLSWLHKLHVRDGESGIGVPFSPAFEALLDGRLGGFPWSRAMLHLRHRVCRGTHPEHLERPEWRGSLCHTLVHLVIRHEYSVDHARYELGLPDEAKTRRTLANALLTIERHLDDSMRREQQRQTQPRKPAEWMAAPWVHRRLDGLHREECEQCRRVA